jgi:23S rRNA (pseudouridine1915-N3)-methyltransferase
MQIKIIVVGKIKEKFLQEGIAEYERRLRPYVELQILELAEVKRPARDSAEAAAKEKEGERIMGVIPPGWFMVALDVMGLSWSSVELADAFRTWELAGRSRIAFVIGGDIGLSPSVLARCDCRLSLSRMTFTHPISRLLLLEQIYRACRIRSGEPYHK